MNRKTFSFVGGIFGLVLFLFIGLLPSIVYGGFAGVTLGTAILGAPLNGELLSRALIVFGMAVGLLGTSGVFIVFGSIAGTAMHAVMSMPIFAKTKLFQKNRHFSDYAHSCSKELSFRKTP